MMLLVIWISKRTSPSISHYWWWLFTGAAQCCFVGSSLLIPCPDAKDRSMQLIWKHNPSLISVGRFYLNTKDMICPWLPLILSLHGKYLLFPLQISSVKRNLKTLFAYKNIQRDQQRSVSYRWTPHCRGEKEIWFGGHWWARWKGKAIWDPDLFPWTGKTTGKKLPFFSRSCLFFPGMIRVFEGPEEFPCTNPYSPAGALSLKALARLGQAEYAQLKSISIVRAGCHTSHAVGCGTPNTACGWVPPRFPTSHRAIRDH